MLLTCLKFTVHILQVLNKILNELINILISQIGIENSF